MVQIRVLDSHNKEYAYPVDRPVAEISLGRSQNNDIILSSKAVSRRHAVLQIRGDRAILVNQSPNGVYVAQEHVKGSRELHAGECVTIDQYRIFVDLPAAPRLATPAAPRPVIRQTTGGEGISQGGISQGGISQDSIESRKVRRPTDGPVVTGEVASTPVASVTKPEPRARKRPEIGGKFTVSKKNDSESFQRFIKQMFKHRELGGEPRMNVNGQQAQALDRKALQLMVGYKSKIHEMLKDRLDLHSFEISDYRNPRVIRQVSSKLKDILDQTAHEIPQPYTRQDAFKQMMDEVCGLGAIEDLVRNKGVTEIMVVDREHIYAEINGNLVLTDRYFSDEKAMMTVIERIVVPRGRRIDESSPLVDTRLADGSRVNAVISPLALKDPCLTIRKFPEDRLSIEDLVKFGSLTMDMSKFIGRAVRARKNIIISGGTGSGKTTLLNVMSSFIGPTERVVTIEDAAELQLQQEHVVSLETKPANLEGKGEVSIRDLVRNALRMRPDRIVVGECRGGEALDMLQAMNTGHDGSMTTVHSNSPIEAIARLETLVLMSGMELPTRAIREQIANSVDVIVQQTRFSDGSRRVSYIAEIVGIDDDGFIQIEDIFRYKQIGMDEDHKVEGYHMATGYLPSFLNDFLILGLATEDDFF